LTKDKNYVFLVKTILAVDLKINGQDRLQHHAGTVGNPIPMEIPFFFLFWDMLYSLEIIVQHDIVYW
jgi:hypothetical protein